MTVARELVVQDQGATLGVAIDPVDRPVQAPAVDLQRRALAVLALAKLRLQQPGLKSARLALGLLRQESGQQPLDPPDDRPLGWVAVEFPLGDEPRRAAHRPA